MKRQSITVFLARIVLVFASVALFAEAGNTMLSAVPAAFQIPAGTVNQRVTVAGRLELESRNCFFHPHLAIVSEQGAERL